MKPQASIDSIGEISPASDTSGVKAILAPTLSCHDDTGFSLACFLKSANTWITFADLLMVGVGFLYVAYNWSCHTPNTAALTLLGGLAQMTSVVWIAFAFEMPANPFISLVVALWMMFFIMFVSEPSAGVGWRTYFNFAVPCFVLLAGIPGGIDYSTNASFLPWNYAAWVPPIWTIWSIALRFVFYYSPVDSGARENSDEENQIPLLDQATGQDGQDMGDGGDDLDGDEVTGLEQIPDRRIDPPRSLYELPGSGTLSHHNVATGEATEEDTANNSDAHDHHTSTDEPDAFQNQITNGNPPIIAKDAAVDHQDGISKQATVDDTTVEHAKQTTGNLQSANNNVSSSSSSSSSDPNLIPQTNVQDSMTNDQAATAEPLSNTQGPDTNGVSATGYR